jgi:hypothetical protein
MKIKKGNKVKITSKKHWHGFEIGETVVITSIGYNDYSASNGSCSWYIKHDEFEKVTSKKSLEKRVDALEKQVRQARNLNIANSIIDTAKNICDSFEIPPKPETIYVPNGILDDDGDIINGNHCLHYVRNDWRVTSSIESWPPSTPNQFRLVPCKREDLKAGDVAFRSCFDTIDTLRLSCYCIILDEGYQRWSGKNCLFDNRTYSQWYKIVES